MKNIKEIIENINLTLKNEFKKTLSVSKLNEYIKEPFDDVAKAEECYQKGLLNPAYKYAGMTVNDILTLWRNKANESKYYGNLLDNYADLYLNNDNTLNEWKITNNFDSDIRLKSTCTGVTQFYNNILEKTNYRYVAREIPLYYQYKDYKINGRLDLLLYDENTDAYIIIDWKTTENITTKNYFNSFLLGPASYLDECDMNLYTIQLHIYKLALVNTYKLTTPDKISVYVCNLLRKPYNDNYYKLYGQNFTYNEDLLNTFIEYGNKIFKEKQLNS